MKNQSISVTTLADNGISVKLMLEGQLILKNADTIKKELLAALKSSQHIELVFRNIVKLDLAILQLLVGLQKSAAGSGKSLSLDLELTGTTQAVIGNSGLEKLLMSNFKMQLNGVY